MHDHIAIVRVPPARSPNTHPTHSTSQEQLIAQPGCCHYCAVLPMRISVQASWGMQMQKPLVVSP
jgi:hypothetical protein